MPELTEQAAGADRRSLVTLDLSRVLLLQATVSFGFSLYFLFPKYLSTELGANAGTLGMATAVPLVAAVATTPITGAALDRFGRKVPVSVGGMLVIASSLALAGVRDVGASLYALRLVQGIGFVLGFNGAAACLADVAPPTRIGAAMGLLGAASLLMNALAPFVGEILTQRWGWIYLFRLAAVAGGASILAVWLTSSGPPIETLPAPGGSQNGGSSTLGTFMNGAAYATLITFALPLAIERGAQRVSSYLLGYTLGALLVRVALGGLADRLGHRRVARLALGLMGFVVIVSSLLEPGYLLVFGAGLGVAHGFLYPALAAMAAQGCAPARRGRALSRFAAAFNTGAGVALVGAGWLANAFGYALAFVAVGAVTLLSVLAFTVGPSHPVGDG